MHGILTLDIFISALICATIAIALDRRFFVISAVPLFYAFLGALLPAIYTIDMHVLTCFTVAIIIQFVWVPRPQPDRPAEPSAI
jgi:hypothetical protein